MSGHWYQYWGYLLLYISAYFVFVGVVAGVAYSRRLPWRWVALLQLTYLISMGALAHAFAIVLNSQRLTAVRLEAAYEELTFDPGAPSWVDVGWDAQLLFDSTGGLWGGPLAVLVGVAVLLVLVRETVETKGALADAVAVAFPFSLAVAKLACLLNGCCHGIEGQGLPYVTFDWLAPNSEFCGMTVFPTQAADAGLYTLWGVILAVSHRRGQARGQLLPWFVMLVGVGRFATEFTRGDGEGPPVLGLTPVQVVLLFAVPAAAVLVSRPGLFARMMAWRSVVETPALSADVARRLRRLALVQIGVFALAFPLFPLLPLLLLVSLPLLLGALIGLLRRPDDPLWRERIVMSFGYLAAGAMFVAAFLVVQLGVTFVSAAVLLVGMSVLYGVERRGP